LPFRTTFCDPQVTNCFGDSVVDVMATPQQAQGKMRRLDSSPSLEVSSSQLLIENLLVSSREVVEYVSEIPATDRADAIVRAIEVGVCCINRAIASQDVEFVRRQLDGLLVEVKQSVEKIPGDIERGLVERIGTEDGQVLAPVRALLTQVSSASTSRVDEVRKLLANDLDPSRSNSTLGKALKGLTELLDPARTDSIQGSLRGALADVTKSDGVVAEVVKKTVAESVAPLAGEVARLALEVRGKQAALDALEATPAKGISNEERVVERLGQWAFGLGARVEHVGGDNHPVTSL
jgi:hypothetical protein